MRRLTNWYEHGYLAVDGAVFDVGIQTSHALQAFRAGARAIDAGAKSERDNGNGSLYAGPAAGAVAPRQRRRARRRCAATIARDARTSARAGSAAPLLSVGAPHPRRRRHPWAAAARALRELYRDRPAELHELERHVRPDDASAGQGSGYVVDCLRSARLALQAGSYEAVVRAAIRLGNDTDTTACVAGGLAGLRDGIDAIPRRWRNGLREPELFGTLLEALVERNLIASGSN